MNQSKVEISGGRSGTVPRVWIAPLAAALALGGCSQSQKSSEENRTEIAPEPRTPGELRAEAKEDARTGKASHQVEVDPDFGSVGDLSGLADSAPVKFAAVRDAILVGQSLKCWPQFRQDRMYPDQWDSPAKIEARLDEIIGKDRPEISCDDPPPLNLPTVPMARGDSAPQAPSGQFADRLPLFSRLYWAFEQGEVPLTRPPPVMRRRWRSAVRIRIPRDAVMADAIRAIISNKSFQEAMHGIPVLLTNEQPNALIIQEATMLGCKPSGATSCFPDRVARGDKWVDGERWPRDRLALQLTGGRRTWFDNGSEFGAAVPIWPIDREEGFTVGSADTIEAANCAVPDNVMDAQWRSETPEAAMAMPSYRQQYAVLCLLRILGVSGVAKDLRYYPTFDRRRLNLISTRGPDNDPTIVVGRAPLRILGSIYKNGAMRRFVGFPNRH